MILGFERNCLGSGCFLDSTLVPLHHLPLAMPMPLQHSDPCILILLELPCLALTHPAHQSHPIDPHLFLTGVNPLQIRLQLSRSSFLSLRCFTFTSLQTLLNSSCTVFSLLSVSCFPSSHLRWFNKPSCLFSFCLAFLPFLNSAPDFFLFDGLSDMAKAE